MPLPWGTYLNFECIYIHKNITPFISVLRALHVLVCFVPLLSTRLILTGSDISNEFAGGENNDNDTESPTDCGACHPAQIELFPK